PGPDDVSAGTRHDGDQRLRWRRDAGPRRRAGAEHGLGLAPDHLPHGRFARSVRHMGTVPIGVSRGTRFSRPVMLSRWPTPASIRRLPRPGSPTSWPRRPAPSMANRTSTWGSGGP